MGIISRFRDIMESNINALLDKCEDPEKMIDQLMRNLCKDLEKVKSETAGIMADEKRAKRDLDACQKEVDSLNNYAMKAVKAGNDNDARKFLAEKARMESKLASLQSTYSTAHTNAENMRAMHDKLVNDINELDSRRDAIKGKMAVAKAQERVNKMVGSSVAGANESLAAFERLETKANKALDKAEAMAQLNKGSVDSMDDLKDKYGSASSDVEDDLAALKASMGMGPEAAKVEDDLAALKASMDATETSAE